MHPLTVYHTWNFTGVLEMRALVNSSVPFGGAAKHPQVHQQAVVAVESCCHEPRVEAVRCHPGPIEKSRQFSREQDVGQLGFAVAAKAPIGALGVPRASVCREANFSNPVTQLLQPPRESASYIWKLPCRSLEKLRT